MRQINGAATNGNDAITIRLDKESAVNLDTLEGNDTVSLYGSGDATLSSGADDDYIANHGFGSTYLQLGGGNDTYLSRGNNIDTVYAQGGNDRIELGNGNDWVKGGGGDDILTGGDGIDIFNYPFIFGTDATGALTVASVCAHDTITDFQVGIDRLSFGPQAMSFDEFSTLFNVDNYDVNTDGVSDGSVLKLTNGDASFSIRFANVQITEQGIYNSVDWFV
jgi:Ca2+-binding RTX toxin-like protein